MKTCCSLLLQNSFRVSLIIFYTILCEILHLTGTLIFFIIELPDLLPLKDIVEALLRVRYGPWLLCRLVGNAPDCFEQGLLAIKNFQCVCSKAVCMKS